MVYHLFTVLCPQCGVCVILSEHHLGEEDYDYYHAPWYRLRRARFHGVAKTDRRDRIMDSDSCGRTAYALDYHCDGDWSKKIKFPSLIKIISPKSIVTCSTFAILGIDSIEHIDFLFSSKFSVRLKVYPEVEGIGSREKSAQLKEWIDK